MVGLVSLRSGLGELEIDTFGLVPSYVGRGLGRPFLVLVTQLAWRECADAHRVWLQTSSHDDCRALGNYERHGFSVCRTLLPEHGCAGMSQLAVSRRQEAAPTLGS